MHGSAAEALARGLASLALLPSLYLSFIYIDQKGEVRDCENDVICSRPACWSSFVMGRQAYLNRLALVRPSPSPVFTPFDLQLGLGEVTEELDAW